MNSFPQQSDGLPQLAQSAVQNGTDWLRDVGQTPQKIGQAADTINKIAPLLRVATVLLIFLLALGIVCLALTIPRLWREALRAPQHPSSLASARIY
jgi:hypothetical protein